MQYWIFPLHGFLFFQMFSLYYMWFLLLFQRTKIADCKTLTVKLRPSKPDCQNPTVKGTLKFTSFTYTTKQMGFLAGTATEKRYDYYTICL